MIKKNSIILFVAALMLASCGSNENPEEKAISKSTNPKDSLLQVIAGLEARVSLLDTTFDRSLARKLLTTYQEYYNQNPRDSLAGAFLYKAGRLAHGMRNYRQAIDLFTNYHDGFPNHPDRPEAAMIVALIYDQDIRDKKSAKKAYERVIELHPESNQAKDAALLLTYLPMTDAEMIEMFKKKNKGS